MKRFLLAAALTVAAISPALAQSPATLRPYSLSVDVGTKTATATAGAATLNKSSGIITSEALTTAAGSSYVLTLTDNQIAAADQVYASVAYGTATTGEPHVARVQPGAGSVVITVRNSSGAAVALNGTIRISFLVIKA